MHRGLVAQLFLLLTVSCTHKSYSLKTFGEFEYCYLFSMVSQSEEDHVLFLKTFDYTKVDDLIELQRFALYYKSKHDRTTQYPFTGLTIVDKYYPTLDMLQFKGVTVHIYFVGEEIPYKIRLINIYKNREKINIKIPPLPTKE